MSEAFIGWRIEPPPPSYTAIETVRGPGAGEKMVEAAGRRSFNRAAIPFGLGDELEAGVAATGDFLRGQIGGTPVDWGALYDEYLGIARRDRDQTREDTPILSGAANVAGSLTTGPQTLLAGARNAFERLGGAALIGGVQGGGWAAGEADGGLARRADAAIGGAATGAVVGGALGGVAELIGRLARGVAYVKGLKGQGAEDRARQMVLDALKADGIDPATLATRGQAGKPLTIADLGENTRALLGATVRQGGDARAIVTDFLEGRSRGQFGRLTQDVADATGTAPTGYAGTRASISGRRAAQAQAGYPAAYASAPPALSPNAVAILNSPDGKKAVATATRFMANMRKPIKDASGRYTVEMLDQIQRAMRDLETRASGARGAELSRNIGNMRSEFLKELPQDLRDVMARYAGQSELLAASEAGRKFVRGDAEELSAQIGQLSQPAQEQFRLGVARELLEMMGRKNITADASAIFQNPNMGQRLARVFGSKRLFQEFMEKAQAERVMQETRNATLKGSQTAARMTEDERFTGSALGEAAADLATGASPGTTGVRAIINVGRGARDRFLEGVNEAVATAASKLLTETDLGRVSGALSATSPQLPAVVSTPLGRGVQAATPRLSGQAGAATTAPPVDTFKGWRIEPPKQDAPAASPISAPARSAVQDAAQRGSVTPIRIAQAFTGANERTESRVLAQFIARYGGAKIDPRTTAWCAAFVNAVLGATGEKGTGSLMARSFLEWGQPVKEPKVGDVVVLTRGDPSGQYGHVGFYAGRDANGAIRVLGGNQSNSVNIRSYPAGRVLGFRRAPAGGAKQA